MPPPTPWLVILLICLMLVGVGLAGWWMMKMIHRLRDQSLARHAAFIGFEHRAEQDWLPEDAMKRIPLFRIGGIQHVDNVVAGRMGGNDILVFRFSYWLRVDREQQSRHAPGVQRFYRQTVALLHREDAGAPCIELREADNVHVGAERLEGHGSVAPPDGVDRPEGYLLRAERQSALHGVITPQLVERLLQRDRLSVEMAGDWTVVYRMDKVVSARRLNEFVQDAIEAAALLCGD